MAEVARRARSLAVATGAAALVAAASGCGGGGTASPATAPGSTAETSSAAVGGGGPAKTAGAVMIMNFTFVPQSLSVAQGTTVTWTNRDSAVHTTTADKGAWNSGNLAQGQTFSFTFTTPGTYTYHCAIHTYMTGSITVS